MYRNLDYKKIKGSDDFLIFYWVPTSCQNYLLTYHWFYKTSGWADFIFFKMLTWKTVIQRGELQSSGSATVYGGNRRKRSTSTRGMGMSMDFIRTVDGVKKHSNKMWGELWVWGDVTASVGWELCGDLIVNHNICKDWILVVVASEK